MKTTILTAAMMILMTAASLNAAPDSTTSVISKDLAFQAAVNLQANEIIEFRVEKPAGEKVSLIIYGGKNNMVYQRILRKENSIALDCDMTYMKKGTYTCVVERNGKEVVRKSITLN
jgi:ABC-type thiamine transport system substrate-binding protein